MLSLLPSFPIGTAKNVEFKDPYDTGHRFSSLIEFLSQIFYFIYGPEQMVQAIENSQCQVRRISTDLSAYS